MEGLIRVSYHGFTGDLIVLEKARAPGIGVLFEKPKGYVMQIWNEEKQELLDFHVENPKDIQFLNMGVAQ